MREGFSMHLEPEWLVGDKATEHLNKTRDLERISNKMISTKKLIDAYLEEWKP